MRVFTVCDNYRKLLCKSASLCMWLDHVLYIYWLSWCCIEPRKCWFLHTPFFFFHAQVNLTSRNILSKIGLLQLAVTWYKLRHAGGQDNHYSRTGTAKQCYFILFSLNFLCFGCPSAGIIISLLSSMADFVPCDR